MLAPPCNRDNLRRASGFVARADFLEIAKKKEPIAAM
jgi:hypothetical protein